MTTQASWLLFSLFFAHYLGDFTPLATARMQEAKANGGPASLIFAHAAVHMLLVATATVLVVRAAWTIIAVAATIELVTHFLIDLARARLTRRFSALRNPTQNAFWFALGVDQLAHGLVLIGVATYVL